MKIIKRIAIGLFVLVLLALGLFYYSITKHVGIGKYKTWYLKPTEEPSEGSVSVQFVGVSTLLISDGVSTFLTDGFFTRPKAIPMLFGEVEPNVEDIKWGIEKLGIDSLAGIIVVHSHFDHAMDAPEVAKLTGAAVYGSESTANICRGWNLPEQQIRIFKDQEPIQFGAFSITPILSNHYEFSNPRIREMALGGDQTIKAPLVPPVPAGDYKMGGAYTFYVEHPKGDFLIQSSAGWKTGSLDSIRTDMVFLGIGGLGAQTEAYQKQYFEELVDQVNAKQLYLIHWDGFTESIRKPIKGSILLTDMLAGNTLGGFEAIEREVNQRPGLKANLLPRWEKIVLFD